jgi:DNA invertase Pin-like site-specific DNA recombinase
VTPDTLVVAKLDRLSRSTLDFATLMERARAKGWGFAILDLGVDTTTASGEMMAGVVATFAQYERRLIGERTKAGLAAKRAQGVQLGRPRTVPSAVRARIATLRMEGASWRAVADTLNEDGVPTGQRGRRWYASTVRKLFLADQPLARPNL